MFQGSAVEGLPLYRRVRERPPTGTGTEQMNLMLVVGAKLPRRWMQTAGARTPEVVSAHRGSGRKGGRSRQHPCAGLRRRTAAECSIQLLAPASSSGRRRRTDAIRPARPAEVGDAQINAGARPVFGRRPLRITHSGMPSAGSTYRTRSTSAAVRFRREVGGPGHVGGAGR